MPRHTTLSWAKPPPLRERSETVLRVLVVEDFEVLATTIGTGLRREGMAVDVVLDGNDALAHLATTRYDVVVLDRDLPGVRGDEVCRTIVAEGSGTRVLMLTAAGTVKERVDSLRLGADDYLPKPFDFSELVARVRALGRRSTTPLPPTLERGDVTLDPSRRVAFRARTAPGAQSGRVRRTRVSSLVGRKGALYRGTARSTAYHDSLAKPAPRPVLTGTLLLIAVRA
jgi:DNA-binding response OmpR family regulator